MKLDSIPSFVKSLLQKAVKNGDIVVDATIGNGYDTVFLAELVGEKGRVFGFDVQEEAVNATQDRINRQGLSDRVTLFHCGHEHILENVPSSCYGRVTGATFNLGYLPGSNKAIVTKPETTIPAIRQLLEIMEPEGIIVVEIYHGHPGGAEERDALLQFCQQLDQKAAHVLQYQFINQKNYPPFIIAIEKR